MLALKYEDSLLVSAFTGAWHPGAHRIGAGAGRRGGVAAGLAAQDMQAAGLGWAGVPNIGRPGAS